MGRITLLHIENWQQNDTRVFAVVLVTLLLQIFGLEVTPLANGTVVSITRGQQGPHISSLNLLLPPRTTRLVHFRLHGFNGCFTWSWDHHDILSVEPEFNATVKHCATTAVLTSTAPYSSQKATAVYATDVFTGQVLRCEPAWFTMRSCISFIKPDQAMWYLACTSCNRKVSRKHSTSCWCEGCQKTYESCNRRYIMLAKLSDYSGEAWISAFNEQAEQILGQPAESLANVRAENPQDKVYEGVLKKASWVSRTSVVTVAPHEYQGEKRQQITVRSVGPVDWAPECKLVLEKIAARS